ncbi:DUF2306 domain-containing protein [Acidiluteibacter ferrifornacis]|uniref:DUF2306 domain-containing protein n=1 Tax=Acidiluteibacter ferrifornacis TaxID=2692424 RepID=A0A6N9NLW0_9FLAO|nr:DUF2306 domain-containing protein [Acidiluteibacter ferrifornacis]NBG65555.1 DUF2306 domain-containing protein [Acidiluteibacter ferrifornacis]
METILNFSLIIHIISGFTALTSGLIVFILKKGNKQHKKIGRVFFYAMLMVIVSALLISVLKQNLFLFMIAIFSLYMNYSGYRSIQNKTLKPNSLDWIVLGIGALNMIGMIYSLNIVLMIFGGISISLVIGDIRIFIKTTRGLPIPRMAWLRRHIGMMMGTYIATVTAFIVTAGPRTEWYSSIQPQWLPWILPSLVLTPMIMYYTKKYASKK